MRDIRTRRVGEHIGAYRRHGRRYASYSLAIGGGLVANVVDGTLTSFGLEPCTAVLIGQNGNVVGGEQRRPVLEWAAPLAGAAAAAAAGVMAATGAVLRHRRAA